MLILGDLACPNEEYSNKLKNDIKQCKIFENQVVLCNLEGMICDTEPYKEEKLFNHSSTLDAFKNNKTIFSLANNHTYDYPELIDATQKMLNTQKMHSNGIIENNRIIPTEFCENEKKYAVFTHCWKIYTKTNPNLINEKKVIDCSYFKFVKEVSEYIEKHKDVRVICYFHWNYDLESLPFIVHRKLARNLIDIGAYAVIGNHSHVPQGGEIYKEKVIVYGLGNFFIPSNYFFNRKLCYPEESRKMMILELDDNIDKVVCHWFWTNKNNKCLEHICSESFENGKYITEYSPYRKMNDKEYEQYFRKNRKKRFLVPVFKKYDSIGYIIKEYFAIFRIRIIKKIKSRG